ncbi:MAG: hypothetical protein ACOC2K_03495 [Bacteroidota bacterium]
MKLLALIIVALLTLMIISCAEEWPDGGKPPELKQSREEVFSEIKQSKYFDDVSLGSGYSTGRDFSGNFLSITLKADSIPSSKRALMNHARKAARILTRNVSNIEKYEFIEVSIVESGLDDLFYTGSTHDFRFRVKEFLKKGIG